MPRIQGLAESGILQTGQLIKSVDGYVFSITIAYKGVTAGDIVTLTDGLGGAAPIEAAFVLPAANGTITKEWPQGKQFDTGIYLDTDLTGAGQIWVELTYK